MAPFRESPSLPTAAVRSKRRPLQRPQAAGALLVLLLPLKAAAPAELELVKACGPCERRYIEKLAQIQPEFGARVGSFLCPYLDQRISDAEMIFVVSPGTTGTRDYARRISQDCGLVAFHYAHWFLPPKLDERRFNTSGVIAGASTHLFGRELALLNNMDKVITLEEADARFLGIDFIGHVLHPKLLPEGRVVAADAILDSPADRFFYDFYRSFPRARFVLLDRDPAAWTDSRVRNHGAAPVPILRCPSSWKIKNYPAEHTMGAFAAFYELVRCLVPPERLLQTSFFVGERNCSTARVMADTAAFLANTGHKCVVTDAEACGVAGNNG